MKDSAEKLVLRYLLGRRQIVPSHDIQTTCKNFWQLNNIYHSPATYLRAWQRLVQSGAVKVKKEWYDHGAKVVSIYPIPFKAIKKLKPIPHGGKS